MGRAAHSGVDRLPFGGAEERRANVTDLLSLDPTRGLVRGVRAAVLTVPAVGAASLAHASVGGCTTAVGMLLAGAVCWPLAVAALRRRGTLLGLLGWLAVAQALTHVLLEWTCPDVMSGRMGLLQHLTMGTTPSMLLMHLGSLVVTAVLLSRADAGLWCTRALLRACARATRLVAELPSPPAVAVRPVRVTPAAEPTTYEDVWKAPRPARRGPPALLAF